MPQQQIDIGTVAATGKGDFILKVNQVQFARTTDATAQQIEVFNTSDGYAAGSVTLEVVVQANILGTTTADTLTTLTNDLAAFDDSLSYTGADPPFNVGDYIQLDDDRMFVGHVDSTTNTLSSLIRAVTPVEHTAGAIIYLITDAGATPTVATWGKTLSCSFDLASQLSTTRTPIRDLFPAVKSAGALTWGCDIYSDGTILFAHIQGQAATTIDWTIRSAASIYYLVT